MVESVFRFARAAVFASCGFHMTTVHAETMSFTDDRATTIDSAREFRIFSVAADPNEVVTGVEASVSFSRFPDPVDNRINPFYEDIRIAIISPEQTFVPLIDFDSFDTDAPDPGFSGTLLFREDAPRIVGDSDGDRQPDGTIVEGTFRPAKSFSEFSGERAAGGWILLIEDRLNGTGLDYLGAEFTLHIGEGVVSPCDVDGVDCEVDIDELTLAIKNNSADSTFDLNGDVAIDASDRRHWIVDLNNTYFGDSNLDGRFDSSDFISVFRAAEYDDSVDGNSTWKTGDWNGDCEFDSGDFIVAFQEAGYNIGPRSSLVAVPEPTFCFSCVLLALAFIRRSFI